MATIIQLRNDIKENWELNNPVLAEGEVGIELDTNKMKVGDGNTAWADLKYMVSGGGDTPGGGSSNADMTIGSVVSSYLPEKNSLVDSDVVFTINTSVEDIRKDLNDRLVVLSRNKHVNGQRKNYDRAEYVLPVSPLKATRMKDDRIMTSLYMKCWCLCGAGDPELYDNWDNLYFYTFETTEDAQELRNIDPIIYGVSGEYNCVCTCFNRIADNGNVLSDYDAGEELVRMPQWDVDHIENWNKGNYWNNEEGQFETIEENAFRYNDHFVKMHCHEFLDQDGVKRYFWAQNWKIAGSGSPVYACADSTKIIDKYSDLVVTQWTTGSIPFEHVSERQDLRVLKYIGGDQNGFIIQMCGWMDQWSVGYTGNYFDDYPIKPIPLSKCFVKVPVLTGDQELTPGATTLQFVKADEVEDWQWEKLNPGEAIEFKLPFTASHIAMRFFGYHKTQYAQNPKNKNSLKYFAAIDAGRLNMTGTLQKKPVGADNYLGSEYVYLSIESYKDVNHNKVNKTPMVKKSVRIRFPSYAAMQTEGTPGVVFVDLV